MTTRSMTNSLSPAISLIESTVGVPANVYRAIIGKGTWAAAARSAAGGATLLTGLPITPWPAPSATPWAWRKGASSRKGHGCYPRPHHWHAQPREQAASMKKQPARIHHRANHRSPAV